MDKACEVVLTKGLDLNQLYGISNFHLLVEEVVNEGKGLEFSCSETFSIPQFGMLLASVDVPPVPRWHCTSRACLNAGLDGSGVAPFMKYIFSTAASLSRMIWLIHTLSPGTLLSHR